VAPNEIQALVAGATAGAVAVSTGHAWWAGRAANRAATEAETALKQMIGEHWLNEFRLYQVQQRAKGKPGAPAAVLGKQKFPITTHQYEGFGWEAPCTAAGYGTACGQTEYDHEEPW